MEKSNPGEAQYYQIMVAGHLNHARINEFGDMSMTLQPDGQTLISGFIVDQAALFGFLIRIRDMGIPLISVSRIEPKSVGITNHRKES